MPALISHHEPIKSCPVACSRPFALPVSISPATHVERHGRITHGCLGLYSDDNEAALARVVTQARRMGSAKFGIQIAHSGRKGSAQRPWEGAGPLKPEADPWPTIAASPIPFGDGWQTPREMPRPTWSACVQPLFRPHNARCVSDLMRLSSIWLMVT